LLAIYFKQISTVIFGLVGQQQQNDKDTKHKQQQTQTTTDQHETHNNTLDHDG